MLIRQSCWAHQDSGINIMLIHICHQKEINIKFQQSQSLGMTLNPSMPDHSEKIPSWTTQDEGYLEGEEESNGVDDNIVGALRECLEEIDIKGKELFKKIVSNGDMEIPLGRLAREALGESRGKDFLGKLTTKLGKKMNVRKDTERGAGIGEELNRKLERFKVKTVNIGGVVKEDQK